MASQQPHDGHERQWKPMTGGLRRSYRSIGWCVALALIVGLTGGCVSFDPFAEDPKNTAPVGVPCQVVATWGSDVSFVPDPVHRGQPGPGLTGRVYLFGSKIDYPTSADGTLVVDLYNDADTIRANGVPLPIEEWRLDPATLKRLLRKDFVGWGYTVFLPWGTYRPDITRVHLRVCFQPVGRAPIYTEGSPMTLRGSVH